MDKEAEPLPEEMPPIMSQLFQAPTKGKENVEPSEAEESEKVVEEKVVDDSAKPPRLNVCSDDEQEEEDKGVFASPKKKQPPLLVKKATPKKLVLSRRPRVPPSPKVVDVLAQHTSPKAQKNWHQWPKRFDRHKFPLLNRADFRDEIKFLKGGGLGAVFTATHSPTSTTYVLKLLLDGDDWNTEVQGYNDSHGIRSVVDVIAVMVLPASEVNRLCNGITNYKRREDHEVVPSMVFAQWTGSLKEAIDDNSIRSWGLLTAVGLIKDAARAVAYLHKKGNMHRDIKPDNILYKTNNNLHMAALCDMGLATKVVPNFKGFQRDEMTQGVGTHKYMAPECKRSGDYAKAADVYSLAVTMWEVVSASCRTRSKIPKELAELKEQGDKPNPAERCSSRFFYKRLQQIYKQLQQTKGVQPTRHADSGETDNELEELYSVRGDPVSTDESSQESSSSSQEEEEEEDEEGTDSSDAPLVRAKSVNRGKPAGRKNSKSSNKSRARSRPVVKEESEDDEEDSSSSISDTSSSDQDSSDSSEQDPARKAEVVALLQHGPRKVTRALVNTMMAKPKSRKDKRNNKKKPKRLEKNKKAAAAGKKVLKKAATAKETKKKKPTSPSSALSKLPSPRQNGKHSSVKKPLYSDQQLVALKKKRKRLSDLAAKPPPPKRNMSTPPRLSQNSRNESSPSSASQGDSSSSEDEEDDDSWEPDAKKFKSGVSRPKLPQRKNLRKRMREEESEEPEAFDFSEESSEDDGDSSFSSVSSLSESSKSIRLSRQSGRLVRVLRDSQSSAPDDSKFQQLNGSRGLKANGSQYPFPASTPTTRGSDGAARADGTPRKSKSSGRLKKRTKQSHIENSTILLTKSSMLGAWTVSPAKKKLAAE